MAATVILVAAAYWPGLVGDFAFDDSGSIVSNPGVQPKSLSLQALWDAAMSGTAGPLGRPLSMVSFALNFAAAGLDPYYFKLTNLVIHCVCGLLVFGVAQRILTEIDLSPPKSAVDGARGASSGREVGLLAFLCSTIWLLHPLNLTSVLYVVQRMNSLSALFLFAGLYGYLVGRSRLRQATHRVSGRAIICVSVVLGTTSAALAKENGVLLPLFVATLEICLLRFRATDVLDARLLRIAAFGACGVALAFGAGTTAWKMEWLQSIYAGRDFSLGERLLTQARVLWFYLYLVIVPLPGNLGIFHDSVQVSRSLLTPWTTAFSVVGWLLLLALMTWLWVRLRGRLCDSSKAVTAFWLASFGVIWYFVGHSIESTILPLELVHEHRNYVPLFGLVFASVAIVRVFWPPRFSVGFSYALAACVIASLSVATGARAYQWGDSNRHAVMEAGYHPDSPRAQYQLGRMHMQEFLQHGRVASLEPTRKHFLEAARLAPWDISGWVALIRVDSAVSAGPPQMVYWTQILRILRDGPGNGTNVKFLDSVYDCQLIKRCVLSEAQNDELVSAVLGNPKFQPLSKAHVLTLRATDLAYRIQDLPYAGTHFLAARDLLPDNPELRFNFADWLVLANRLDEAEAEIIVGEKRSPLGLASTRSANLRAAVTRSRDLVARTLRERAKIQ